MLRSLLMKAQTGWSVLDNVTTSNIYHNDHPVCAASEASRLFLTGAASPPVPGGEHPVLAIHSQLHTRQPMGFRLRADRASPSRWNRGRTIGNALQDMPAEIFVTVD